MKVEGNVVFLKAQCLSPKTKVSDSPYEKQYKEWVERQSQVWRPLDKLELWRNNVHLFMSLLTSRLCKCRHRHLPHFIHRGSYVSFSFCVSLRKVPQTEQSIEKKVSSVRLETLIFQDQDSCRSPALYTVSDYITMRWKGWLTPEFFVRSLIYLMRPLSS